MRAAGGSGGMGSVCWDMSAVPWIAKRDILRLLGGDIIHFYGRVQW